MLPTETVQEETVSRPSIDVDIVCVGFGPATGGFLTTLSRGLLNEDGTPIVESSVMPGMPPQVLCYERADDFAFGVSGAVTRARAIRASFPDLDPDAIPMAGPVTSETFVYLCDPFGASRRPRWLQLLDRVLAGFRTARPKAGEHVARTWAAELPFVPAFLRKDPGLVLSLGQFNQWVAQQLMAAGTVQLWPGTPVAEPLLENGGVAGVRLASQGTDEYGVPQADYMPGMDIRAPLTVIADGAVGAIGRQLDAHFGLPKEHHQRDWALGMKMVVDLPESCQLQPGTVIHTLGYPEPGIFGFLYVYPERTAALGIFVPSWFNSPVRTAYRYLQYWMLHPYLWKHLDGGRLRSWGAKSIQEAGRAGEPILAGDGFARIGEGSGSTNVLTNSGVDEAWATGVQLAEAVLGLLKEKKPYTRENLEATYLKRRRASWVEQEGRIAEHARDGFQKGFLRGLIGTALAGLTRGAIKFRSNPPQLNARMPRLEEYYRGRITPEKLNELQQESRAKAIPLHDLFMRHVGWPEIPLDGKLLVSHQDALLLGGKVQAPGGYANHVVFRDPQLCKSCAVKLCVEMCSGQAITLDPDGDAPAFDREKCVHCGACIWNCAKTDEAFPERGNIEFLAGAGGLHSAEN